MKIQKQRYLKEFCKRLRGKTKEQVQESLNVLLSTIEDEKDEIKRRYADNTFEFSSDDDQFVKMILFDAVFIFELFLKNEEDMRDNKRYQDDFIIGKPWLRAAIQRDLILLENQLPFFILEKLYSLAIEETKPNYRSFLDLSCHYFGKYGTNKTKPYKPLHFTDLVRHFLSYTDPRSAEPIGKFYSATKLHEAAINFKELRNECLLDVKFSSTKGELRIPCLQIDHHTELLFGNLIALEWCHYKGKEYISHYVKLLDTLVAKPKDVALLIKNNIIDTKRDGASVKNLIDKLSAETSEEYSIYYNLYKQLDTHYQNSWLKNSAYLREVYFGNLWRSTATLSATVLLLFTLVQTICSVLSLR